MFYLLFENNYYLCADDFLTSIVKLFWQDSYIKASFILLRLFTESKHLKKLQLKRLD